MFFLLESWDTIVLCISYCLLGMLVLNFVGYCYTEYAIKYAWNQAMMYTHMGGWICPAYICPPCYCLPCFRKVAITTGYPQSLFLKERHNIHNTRVNQNASYYRSIPWGEHFSLQCTLGVRWMWLVDLHHQLGQELFYRTGWMDII